MRDMKREPILKTTLLEAVRRAVRQSPLPRAVICRAAGIHEAALSRFVSAGLGLSVRTLDRLVDVLELKLVPRRKARRQKRKAR